MGVLSQAKGAAIDYTIHFTATSGVAPTAGSFAYDGSSTTNPFSNFTVVWQSITFDFTQVANTVEVNSQCPTPNGSIVGGFNFEALFSTATQLQNKLVSSH